MARPVTSVSSVRSGGSRGSRSSALQHHEFSFKVDTLSNNWCVCFHRFRESCRSTPSRERWSCWSSEEVPTLSLRSTCLFVHQNWFRTVSLCRSRLFPGCYPQPLQAPPIPARPGRLLLLPPHPFSRLAFPFHGCLGGGRPPTDPGRPGPRESPGGTPASPGSPPG